MKAETRLQLCPSVEFRPTFWATVAAVPVFLMLLGLGFWQLERMEWKNALVAEMRGRMTSAPIALPDPIEDPGALRFRRVTLEGHFLHGEELHRVAQTYGSRRGLFVITPMRLEDGREILVNRGWVPVERQGRATRPEGEVAGKVSIEAIVRVGGWSGFDWLRPHNRPGSNQWLWMDLPAMAAEAGLARPVTEVYVDAVRGQGPGRYPIGGQTRVNLRNAHLEYAVTWFALAGVLLAIYLLFHLRPHGAGHQGKGDDEGDDHGL